MNGKIIFIGPCGGGGTPINGASAKNCHLIRFLREHGADIKMIDTERWKRNPMILMSLLFSVLCYPKACFIVATSSISAYHIIRVFGWLHMKRNIIYWVIGGSLANWIKQGKMKASAFRHIKYFLVEGRQMQEMLQECGFDNAIYVPNFKPIYHIPVRPMRRSGSVKFVFLSRIIPPKGCGIIIDAVKCLNMHCDQAFGVDFYGPIEDGYRQEFLHEIEHLDNVSYKGILDLSQNSSYDELACYDAMLFPTGWVNEGFPGIAIDAFVAGLPVIATDWNINAEVIENGKLGFIMRMPLSKEQPKCLFDIEYVPFEKDKAAEILADTMQMILDNPDMLAALSINCQRTAMQYDIRNVLTKDFFELIGLS